MCPFKIRNTVWFLHQFSLNSRRGWFEMIEFRAADAFSMVSQRCTGGCSTVTQRTVSFKVLDDVAGLLRIGWRFADEGGHRFKGADARTQCFSTLPSDLPANFVLSKLQVLVLIITLRAVGNLMSTAESFSCSLAKMPKMDRLSFCPLNKVRIKARWWIYGHHHQLAPPVAEHRRSTREPTKMYTAYPLHCFCLFSLLFFAFSHCGACCAQCIWGVSYLTWLDLWWPPKRRLQMCF